MSSFPSPFMPRRRPEDELNMLAPVGGLGIGRFAGTPGGFVPISAPDPGRLSFGDGSIPQSRYGGIQQMDYEAADPINQVQSPFGSMPMSQPTQEQITARNQTLLQGLPPDQQAGMAAAAKAPQGPITPAMGGWPGALADAMGGQTGYEPVAGPLERTFVDVGGRVGNIVSPIANLASGAMKFAGMEPPQTLQDIGGLSRDAAQYSAQHPPTSYPEAIARRAGGTAATAMSLYGSPVLNAAGRIGGIVGSVAGPIGRFAGGIAGFEAGQAIPQYLADQPTYGDRPQGAPSGADIAESIAKSPMHFAASFLQNPTPDFSSPQKLYESTAPLENLGVLGGLHLTNKSIPEPRATPAEASSETSLLPAADARRGSQPTPDTAMRMLNPGSNWGNLFMAKDAADGAGKEIKLDPELTVTPEKPLFPTGIKKAIVDDSLKQSGAEPVEHGQQTTFEELNDKAKIKLANNPNYATDLIDKLKDSPRALTAEETPIVAHHWVKLENDLTDARKLRDSAEASGNPEDIGAAKIAMARIVDQKRDMAGVLKRSGYEKGASLAAQKMLYNSDASLYDLGNMIVEKEAAGTGEKLTPEKQAEVEKAHDKIQSTKKAYEQASEQATTKQRTEARDEAAGKVEQEADHETKVERIKTGKVTPPKPENIAGITAKYEDTDKTPQDLSRTALEIEKHFWKQGMKDRGQREEAVHQELVKINPDMTKSDTLDALSGYGKFKQLNKGEMETSLRQGHGEMQQIRKLEDMASGKAPLKTGMERREPSDLERRLIKEVNEAKKKGGFNFVDPAKQLKSALATQETRLTNSIKDIEAELASGQRAMKGKNPVPTSPKTEALKRQLDDLRKQRDEIFGKPEMTDEQRVKMATAAAEKSIAEYERRIKEKDLFPGKPESKTPQSNELDAVRAKRDALKDQLKELQDLARPRKTPEEIALAAIKTRTTKSIADYQSRLARGDFATKTRTPVELTPEIKALKAEHERAKIEWQKGLAEDRHAKRFWWEKAMDGLANFRRFGVLTSPAVIPKLAAAGATRLITKPLELAVGGAWAKVFPELAKGAPLEGQGLNIKAEAAAAGQALQGLGKEMWKKLKTGQSDIEALHDDPRTNDITEFGAMVGRTHGVLKEPVLQMDFYSSEAKLLEAAAKNGEDITDKTVIARVYGQALQHAKRQIFQQKDNRITQIVRNTIRQLEAETQKLHDHPKDANLTKAVAGKALATGAKMLMPIVSVPTNIATETGVYATGLLPTGIAEAVYHTWKGAEKLPPDQKDMIMRHLSKGTLGAAALLTGFFNPSSIGGYYQPGKRKADDAQFGSIKMFGKNIPSLLLHNPLLEVLQIGATIRRVYDAKKSKGESGPSAAFSGLAQGVGGAALNVPVARESVEIGKMLEPGNDKPLLNFGKSLIIPQVVNVASKTFFGKDLIYSKKKARVAE